MYNLLEAYSAVYNQDVREDLDSQRDYISEMQICNLTKSDLVEIAEEVVEIMLSSGISIKESQQIVGSLFTKSNITGRQQKIDRLQEAFQTAFRELTSKASNTAVEEFGKYRNSKKLQESWSARFNQDKRVERVHNRLVAEEIASTKELLILMIEEKDDSYLETDMKKRAKNNEKALADMKTTKAHKDMVGAARRSMGIGEALDPVGEEDDDIDNDGDSDESDEYLKKRRKAIGKSMKKRGKKREDGEKLDEAMMSSPRKDRMIDKYHNQQYKKGGGNYKDKANLFNIAIRGDGPGTPGYEKKTTGGKGARYAGYGDQGAGNKARRRAGQEPLRGNRDPRNEEFVNEADSLAAMQARREKRLAAQRKREGTTAAGNDFGHDYSLTPAQQKARRDAEFKAGMKKEEMDSLSKAYLSVFSEEESDKEKDSHLERGGHAARADYSKAPKQGRTDGAKKSGGDALAKVKADIMAKYGKGAIMDTKKKRRDAEFKAGMKNEEFDLFDTILEFLYVEGYVDTLEEAEWMMANLIDEEAIDIILGEEQLDEALTGERYKKVMKNPGGTAYSRKVSADPAKRATRGGRGGESDFGAGDRGAGNKAARRAGTYQEEEFEIYEVLDTPEKANEYARKNVRSMLGAFAKGVVNKDINQLKTINKRKRGAELGKRKAERKAAEEQNESFEAWLDEAMSNYEKNRKRAAQRAAARNAARDQGKTGAVPGVGYVTPRRERETWTDESGQERHTSGARMPKKDKK